jgi:hypothetical protein
LWYNPREASIGLAEDKSNVIEGEFSTISWLKKRFTLPEIDDTSSKLSQICASTGNITIIEWFITQGFEMNELAWKGAAKRGHIHILEWLKKALARPKN